MTGLSGRRLGYLAITLGVVALDRVTKMLAESRLDPYRPRTVIPDLFDLTLVRNPGGVFGILKNLDPGFRSVLFTLIPMVAILLILYYTTRVPASHTGTHLSLALILGGAVGNLIDRVSAGHVTDFLDFHWRGYHWPAFNLADSAICAGVGLLILESLFHPEPSAPDEETRPAEPWRGDAP